MTSFPIPRKYYLTVHDALRKVLGKDASISAFATSKKPFQCDMLVNSPATDPLVCDRTDFAVQLQRNLGTCGVAVTKGHLDVTFSDREAIALALGAANVTIEDVNKEPDWKKRDRLRISLGFDKYLFYNACELKVILAARQIERWVYDTYPDSPEMWPPIEYWLAHGYALSLQYQTEHHLTVYGTIIKNFSLYYGKYPLDNPFCPGEDLNTMACAKKLCESWRGIQMDSDEYVEITWGDPNAETKDK